MQGGAWAARVGSGDEEDWFFLVPT